MVVTHNLLAANASRQLGITTYSKKKSSEKLASGYRINRAADDAAGLSISEKLRSQVRGLNMASKNIQDGISLVQVADGALNETHALLQRMRELSVQAANDTNASTDREAIQQEMNQLTAEIDRIATTTSYNSEIYPLNTQKVLPEIQSNGMNVTLKDSTWSGVYNNSQGGTTYDGVMYDTDGQAITLKGISLDNGKNILIDKNGNMGSYIPFAASRVHKAWIYASHSLSLKDLNTDEDRYVYYMSKTTGHKMYLSALDNGIDSNGNIEWLLRSSRKIQPETLRYSIPEPSRNAEGINIQSGCMSGEGIPIDFVDATCSGIGLIVPTDVSSFEKAGDTINNIDEAIDNVSAYRSAFGALQNRLEHAMAVDDNISENTDASESRIRDTDMAKEMVDFSKHSILEQAGQSVLAQANQITQGVLSLIR